jgi:23S rRNA pseudouridine1911/1915/1917 synthase
MAQWTVNAREAGVRLDKFLAGADRIGSRVRAATALERGKIFLNEREMTLDQAGTRLAAGDVVRAWMDRPGSAKRRATLGDDRDLPIVYEDDTLVVLDKPAGLLAVPLPLRRRENARSVFDDLKEYLRRRGRRRPFVVHRIDRDTSGLVVFAKSAAAQDHLKDSSSATCRSGSIGRSCTATRRQRPAPGATTWCGTTDR